MKTPAQTALQAVAKFPGVCVHGNLFGDARGPMDSSGSGLPEREYRMRVGLLIEQAAVSLKGGFPARALAALGGAVTLAEQNSLAAQQAGWQLERILDLLHACDRASSSIAVSMRSRELVRRTRILSIRAT